jgi:hypothetical protein
MSELKEIAVIILKHLSDALLSAACELSNVNSKNNPIIVNSEAEKLEIKVGVHVIFALKRGKKGAGIVNKVDGDLLEVSNKVTGKTWTVQKSEVLHTSKGDFYY